MNSFDGDSKNPPRPLSLRTNIIWSSVGSLLRTLCNWLITVAVVRLSPSSAFDAAGVLALSMSISNLIIPIAEYRLRTVHVTDVRDEYSTQQYMGMRVISSVVALISGTIYTLVTSDPSFFLVIFIYCVSQLISTYAEGFHAVEQRYMRMDYIGISYLLQGFGSLIFFCAGMYFFHSLLAAVSLMTVAIVATVLFYDLPRARRFGTLYPRIELRNASRTFITLFPLAVVNVALNIISLVPRQYLTHYANAEALGIYASIAVPAVVIQASAAYIYTPILGRLVELLHSNQKKAKTMLLRIVGVFFGVGIVCALGFLVAGDWILALIFGEKILPYTYLVQPALLFSLITAFVWFANDLLLGLRDYLGCFLGGLTAAVATLATTIPFTRMFVLNAPSFVGIFASAAALAVMGFFFAKNLRKLSRPHASTQVVPSC